MATTYEYDPVKGLYHRMTDTADGGLEITPIQNVQASLDWAKKQRNNGHNDMKGLRDSNDIKHYATITPALEMELKKKGINMWSKDPDMQKRFFREIEQNYPYAKVTNRKHL